MRNRFITIFLLAAAVACGPRSYAQNSTADYVSSLRLVESRSGARAVVSQDDVSTRALNAVRSAGDRIGGMRVTVFFDNGQNARSAAAAAQSQLRSLFPGVPDYMTYPAPFFKVQAGDCLNRTEATRLYGMLKNIFPKATISNESIPLSYFTTDHLVIETPERYAPSPAEEGVEMDSEPIQE